VKNGLLRFAAFGLLFLLALTVAAAWVVPPLLDWNRYRGDIAELVSVNLGRDVRIEGPISLQLLPEPILTAGKISVADAQDGVTIAVAELRVRLALLPLLSERVDAQELVLRGLDIRLPWPLNPSALEVEPPTWLSSISARIEKGSVAIGNVAATDIDASLGLVPDTGSITLAGTTSISGQSWHVSGRLTRSGRDGSAGLDISLDGLGPMQGLGALFTGQIGADGGLSGRIGGRGPDLSRLIAAPAVPFRADGRVTLAAGLAVADSLSMEIAGSPAHGAVSLRLQPALRLDVALAASRLDLDTWLPALLRGGAGRIVASIPTGIDLSSGAATLAGGSLRDLRGNFELMPGTVTLRDVSAILPGDAPFSMAGQVRVAAGSGLHFDGKASVSAPNLRTTLTWLETAGLAPLANLPDGVLQSADLRAGVTADTGNPAQIVLTDLNGVVDSSHVQGGLSLRPGARLGVAGSLSADRVALDPWLSGGISGLAGLPARFGKLDLDLQLHADQASLREQILAPTALDIGLESGRLTLRRLDVQSPGVRLVVSGSINDAGRISDGKLEIATGTDAAGPVLTSWVPAFRPIAAHLPHGALSFNLLASGPPEALALRAMLDLGDLHIEAAPTFNLPGARWSSPLTLRHPGAPRLLDSIGFASAAPWLGDGSLSWVGNLSGAGPLLAPTRIASDGFDLAAGSLRANGALALDLTGTPKLTGRISAETLPLPLLALRAPDPLPTGLLAGWAGSVKFEAGQILVGQSPVLQHLATTISLDGGTLRLDGIAATLASGKLSGKLALAAADGAPALSGELALAGATPAGALFELPLDLSGGVLDASAKLTASGYSSAALLATLSGTLSVSGRDGVIDGIDLARAGLRLEPADLRAALAGGSTAFEQLDLAATLTNGAVNFTSARFNGPAGTGDAAGFVDIAGRTMEMRLALHPAVTDPPELGLRLSGSVAAPARTPELADAIRWRTEHPPAAPAWITPH
jgi:hypothetical protein